MSDNNKQQSTKSDSSSLKSKHRRSRKTVRTLPTKVIIRNLPPKLTSKQFLEQVSPVSDHNYYYYVKGDPLLGLHSYSRAYINFINQDDILHFREKFDNYVFVDDKGNEYTAVVELALYQGVPKRRSKKIDPKCKTIENDQNFLQFLEDKENLSKANNNLPSVEECLEEIKAKEETGKQEHIQLTPLLEYLNNKKKGIDLIGNKKKILTKDNDRFDKKKKDDRRSKWEWDTETSTSNSIKNKEKSSRDKESRRFRRRRDEKKSDDKYRDDDRFSREDKYRDDKYRDDKYRDDKYRDDKYRDDKYKSDRLKDNKSKTDKKDEPKATFTVKILTNEKRNEKIDNQSNKDNTKLNDKSLKDKDSRKSISNKERPSIQIYKPRQLLKNKDDKIISQDKSTSK